MRTKNSIERMNTKDMSRGIILALVWIFLMLGLNGCYWEKTSHALEATPRGTVLALVLEPAAGPVDTIITIHGEGWPADQPVLVYLTAPDETKLPSYAVANAVVDQAGHFTTALLLSPQWLWEDQEQVIITVRAGDGSTAAQASFTLVSVEALLTPTPLPTVEPTLTVEPTATATIVVPPSVAPTSVPPTATAQPEQPSVTSIANLNIRGGPGVTYAVVSLLRPDQTAEATGLSADGSWWQIKLPGAPDRRGWVSARYVIATQGEHVPMIYVALPSPTPVPTPTPPPVIVDWRGEYYNNLYLSGPPVLVRNDPSINFNWGTGAAAPALPADNFSVRWSRTLPFAEGLYRFHAIIDDGLRLYIDDVLVIDDWRDGGWREVASERWLSAANHHLRIDYYEHTGSAVAQGWWERIVAPPLPVQAEPEADFDADPRKGDVPLRVEFDNDSEGDYDSCRWHFGDDHTSHDCDEPRHTYREAGAYTVRLKVSGPAGEDTKKREDYIIVRPVAQFAASLSNGPAPLTIHFANQSTEHEVCEWDFGDGSRSSEANPTHIYTTPGNYTVCLKIKENDVWSNTEIKTSYITVTADKPVVKFMAEPTVGLAPLNVVFTNHTLGAVNQWHWDFGDGSLSIEKNPVHTYISVGEYTVSLSASGPGGSDSVTRPNYIKVTEKMPMVKFRAAPTSGPAPLDVTFTDDSLGAITAWHWDFGDGVTSNQQNPSHTYTGVGNYTVNSTVSGAGGSNSLSRPGYIQVIESPTPTPEPPTPTPEPPTPTPERPTPTPEPPTPTPTPEPPTPTPEPPTPTPEPPTPTPEPPTPTPEPPTPTSEPLTFVPGALPLRPPLTWISNF